MNMLISAKASQTMTSRQIAIVVNSRHDNVKRAIERLSTTSYHPDGSVKQPAVIVRPPLEDEQITDSIGRNRTESVYVVNERDSYIVVAQLCPEYTADLVDYWMATKNHPKPPMQLTTLEILCIATEAEQGRLQALAERDHAIATKAQIGDKKVATAMATASHAKRKVNALEAELGRCVNHATILAVKNATGHEHEHDWRPLRNWCKERGIKPIEVVDPRWGKVKSWPAQAWLTVHCVDITALFGGKTT